MDPEIKDRQIDSSPVTDAISQFHEMFDARVEDLSPEEKQQFFEGAFLVLDSLTRFGSIDPITPKEGEGLSLPEFFLFLGTLKANIYYAATFDEELDSETNMKPLVETDPIWTGKCTINSALVHVALGHELSVSEKNRVHNMAFRIGLDINKLPKQLRN